MTVTNSWNIVEKFSDFFSLSCKAALMLLYLFLKECSFYQIVKFSCALFYRIVRFLDSRSGHKAFLKHVVHVLSSFKIKNRNKVNLSFIT